MALTYLLIDLAIILGPLLYTRDPRIAYYRNFRALGSSIVVVSGAYISWDMLVTQWGEWSFNPRYISGIKVLNLPLEEILFFITVPYACLFIYEAVITTGQKRHLRPSHRDRYGCNRDLGNRQLCLLKPRLYVQSLSLLRIVSVNRALAGPPSA